jgi:DNA-binding MarR family transcriptional regulator
VVTGGRVAQRRWRMLLILASHGGWYSTADVQTLIGAGPMIVHRDLTALREAGLLQRQPLERDRSHRWLYATSEAGEQQVAEVLRRAGLDVPANLGLWAGHRAIPLFVLLVEASRLHGVGQVVEWRSGADAASWLRHRHGIDGVQVDAYGVWTEGDRAIRFLVQVDERRIRQVVDRLLDQLIAPASLVLPVNAVLLIADADTEEQFVHERLHGASPAVVVATTTRQRMHGPDGPAGAIWSRADSPGKNVRLIELANARPTE